MPTERFYRLPRAKADAIRMAALREFKRVPLEEASINRIIRDADISRGSFYTYFEDKKDLLRWLIDDRVKESRRIMVQAMTESGGDIWYVFERTMEEQLEIGSREGIAEVFANMIKGNGMSEMFQLGEECGDAPPDRVNSSMLQWLFKHLDRTKCPLDEKQFGILMDMHTLAMMLAMKQFFRDKLPKEQVKETYMQCLNMLRCGACPNGKNQDFKEREGKHIYEEGR